MIAAGERKERRIVEPQVNVKAVSLLQYKLSTFTYIWFIREWLFYHL